MTTNPSAVRSGRAPWALIALVLLSLGAVTVWWGVRTSQRRALDQALEVYAEAALPAPEAPVDGTLADLGAKVFDARCAACHALRGASKLGPNLAGVTERRDLPWIRAMVLRPDSMTRDDPVARALLQGFGVQMQVVGGMDGPSALAVIEFLRRADSGGNATP